MNGFAQLDEKGVVLMLPRMSWSAFGSLLDDLARLAVRGDIPLEQRAAYQEHAAALHAAAKALLFMGEEMVSIQDRIKVENEPRITGDK